jgi:hypothetical protein
MGPVKWPLGWYLTITIYRELLLLKHVLTVENLTDLKKV